MFLLQVFTVRTAELLTHIPENSLPSNLGGKFEVDHQAWLVRCLKSMANRHSDLCDITSPTLTKSDSQETTSELIAFDVEKSKSENNASYNGKKDPYESDETQHCVSEKRNVEFDDKERDDAKEAFDSLESAADDTCEDDINGESENYSSSFSQISQNNISIATDTSPTSSETFTDATGNRVDNFY